MPMPSNCLYCGVPYPNFGDDEEGVEMWIQKTRDGEHVIAFDCSDASSMYAWSIPINYCPFCSTTVRSADATS